MLGDELELLLLPLELDALGELEVRGRSLLLGVKGRTIPEGREPTRLSWISRCAWSPGFGQMRSV